MNLNLKCLLFGFALLGGCPETPPTKSDAEEHAAVERQQQVYLDAQPVPMYDWSLERDRATQLYDARMSSPQTWSVWRSALGSIEGDCASSGYPLPYGVSLTSPEHAKLWRGHQSRTSVTLPQAEPNGLFTNGLTTEATWVFCVVDGSVAPVYVETKVTVYPYAVNVDYQTGRVSPAGRPSVVMTER
ncbi:MAG: hypothetical protein P1V36_00425 [Planctomycetota bacterium]|nr:hypothetical protein [Planctomycetota bacterium]